MALKHPYSAQSVVELYLREIYKLHGFPSSIVSDRDPVFLSAFYRELFRLQGVQLAKSTAYHPQTDGQIEVVNRCLETYLRCMTHQHPERWFHWLPMAKWWCNTTYHSSLHITPYVAVYGTIPPIHVPYVPGDSQNNAVDQLLKDREMALQVMKYHLERAQPRMKHQANKHRVDKEFQIGDMVYVKLRPYRQYSVEFQANNKLAPLFFGPFKVEDKIGKVAYKLILPTGSEIHLVFHVSQLKKKVPPTAQLSDPTAVSPNPTPVAILQRRIVKRGNATATKLLIKWSTGTDASATWEFAEEIRKKFPNFDLEAKFLGECNVMK